MSDWISFITVWVCIPLATIAVYEGFRQVIALPFSRSTLVLLVVGGIFLLGRAGFLYWGHSQLRSMVDLDVATKPFPTLSREAYPNMSDFDFAERTRLLASMKFFETGEVTTYNDIAGRELRYAPPQKEIESRVSMQASISELRASILFLQTQIYFLMIAFFTAALSGILAGKRRLQGLML